MQLCRVGLLRVWISVEDVLVVFGGPRTGKTQYLAGRIIDAPGAVLVTSTRTDLYDTTAPLRRERGPVYVFNAVGLAGLPSTITFDPLTGCADPVTARERAADMLGATTPGTRAGWVGGAGVLGRPGPPRPGRPAARRRAGRGCRCATCTPGCPTPTPGTPGITSLLRRSPEQAFETDVAQFVSTNSRTRT